jgi:hypothetical protein
MGAPRTIGRYSTGRSNANIAYRNRAYYDRLRIANREELIRNRRTDDDYISPSEIADRVVALASAKARGTLVTSKGKK